MTTIRNCKFAYRCDRKWEDLDRHYKNNKTPLPDDVRYCGECEKAVYKITDDKELIGAIKLNRCVAIEIFEGFGISEDGMTHTVGMLMRPKDDDISF